MNNLLEFILSLRDNASAGLSKFRNNVKSTVGGVREGFNSIVKHAKVVGLAVGAIAAKIALVTREAAKLEAAMRPFERHMGGREGARAHVGDMQFLAREYGTHSADELINESRQTLNATGGQLGTMADMKLLADMSATTANELSAVRGAVVNFYQQLKMGRDVDRAAKQLENLGLVGTGVVTRLQEMQQAGASSADMWRVVSEEFNQFAGGMDSDADLGVSAMGRLKAEIKQSMQEAGASFLHGSKHIDNLANWLQDLRDSGAIEEWAEKVSQGLDTLMKPLKEVVGWIGKLLNMGRQGLEWAGNFIGSTMANVETNYRSGGLRGVFRGLRSGEILGGAAHSATELLREEEEKRARRREANRKRAEAEREERRKRMANAPGLAVEGIEDELNEADRVNRQGGGDTDGERGASRVGRSAGSMSPDALWDAYYAWKGERSGPQGLEGSRSGQAFENANAFRAINASRAFRRFGRNAQEVRDLREAGAARRRAFVENAAMAHGAFKDRVAGAVAAGDRVVSSSENEHVEIHGRALHLMDKIEKNTRGGIS